MASILRVCLALLVCAFVSAGCVRGDRDFGIDVEIVNARQFGERIVVKAHQSIELSDEAREALRHGVPIRLQFDLALRQEGSWTDIRMARMILQLDYLPLSDRYQVSFPALGFSSPGASPELVPFRSFPRLRHALALISELDYEFDDVDPSRDDYQLRARSRLDRSGMPGPMQLPALLSSQWHHNSGWVTRPVTPSDGRAG